MTTYYRTCKLCDVCDAMSYGGLLDDALHGAELVDGQPALGDVVLTVAVEHVHRVVDGFDFQYLNVPNNTQMIIHRAPVLKRAH